MAINLVKGQRINLEKEGGTKLDRFCVGCNWGAIVTKVFLGFGAKTTEVDLDLSCVLFDSEGKLCDHLYSPLYRLEFLVRYGLLPGKLDTLDGALHHTGDDRSGDTGGDDGLDNEIITVNLAKVNPKISQIFFFLNNCGKEDFRKSPMRPSGCLRVPRIVSSRCLLPTMWLRKPRIKGKPLWLWENYTKPAANGNLMR